MKKISVVILNWNGVGMLQKFLPKVLQYSKGEGMEVCVADNGSTDESVAWLEANCPDVRLVVLDKNYGFADGYNLALQQVEAKYVVLLNSDVEVTPRWLEPMQTYMDAHPEVAACQPKIRAERNREYFEYAGAAGGYLDKYGYPFCRGRIFDVVEKDEGQYDTVRPIFWATGAALFIRLKDYREAGGLDGRFFAHMEEIDLCWRLRLMGYRIMAVPQGEVFHYGGASLDNSSPRKLYLNYRNNLLMMYKNLPADIRAWRIFRRKLYDGVSAVKYLVSGNMPYVKAVWDAHRDYNKMKNQYHTQPAENRLNDLPQGRVNIILDYFLRGKKKYSDLNMSR